MCVLRCLSISSHLASVDAQLSTVLQCTWFKGVVPWRPGGSLRNTLKAAAGIRRITTTCWTAGSCDCCSEMVVRWCFSRRDRQAESPERGAGHRLGCAELPAEASWWVPVRGSVRCHAACADSGDALADRKGAVAVDCCRMFGDRTGATSSWCCAVWECGFRCWL